MDFLAEFVFELLGEVFLENGVDMAADSRLPKWARILILAVTAAVFLAVFGVILLVGIGALSHTLWLSLLLFALDAGLVVLCVCKVRKALPKHSRK